MEIKKIRGNTFTIDTGKIDIPFYQRNEKEIVLLDSGWAESERTELAELLAEKGLTVSGLLCSHARIDPAGNNVWLKEKYGCVIAMPEYEALISSSLINLKAYIGNQSLKDVERIYRTMVCATDLPITTEQTAIELCGVPFQILHTPGHSPAHVCVITPDDVAYLGDCLLCRELMRSAKLPTVYVLSEDLKSKESLYGLRCAYYVLAHKGVYDDITELIAENIVFYKEVAKRVLASIDAPMAMDGIMRAACGRLRISVRDADRYAVIERTLKAYVEYLLEEELLMMEEELLMTDGFLLSRRL